jgi:hypothetical protein
MEQSAVHSSCYHAADGVRTPPVQTRTGIWKVPRLLRRACVTPRRILGLETTRTRIQAVDYIALVTTSYYATRSMDSTRHTRWIWKDKGIQFP